MGFAVAPPGPIANHHSVAAVVQNSAEQNQKRSEIGGVEKKAVPVTPQTQLLVVFLHIRELRMHVCQHGFLCLSLLREL